jgi:hypothetical protein
MSRAERSLSLPWAPRPFAGEALGSWLGRLASAYRMDVDAFAAYAGVSIDFDRTRGNWLALPPLSRSDNEGLRALCRFPEGDLPEPYHADGPAKLGYCRRCLYLNPLDVTAPYWQARWLLDTDSPWCRTHSQHYEYTSRKVVRDHRNMRRLLRSISRRSAALERAAR